jgi:hypothetical protein
VVSGFRAQTTYRGPKRQVAAGGRSGRARGWCVVTPSAREVLWPAGIGHRRGWPLPDAAWDDDCPLSPPGWLPWAIWQRDPDWYVGFYTCDQRHAWTCGHGSVAGKSELIAFRVSPSRIVPSDAYLRAHVGDPGEIRLRLIDWARR